MSGGEKITREELEDKFQSLQDDLQFKVTDKKSRITTGLTVGGSAILFLTYMLGRRRGRKRRSVVEIRRG
ncbi:MAG: hypothetical protein WC864_08260 [Ilumatobacteraceae bacterium]